MNGLYRQAKRHSLKMLVTFKTINEQIFKVDIDPSDTVLEVKSKINRERGSEYDADGMKLLFAGKILDDEKFIKDYKINENAFVMIVVPTPKSAKKGPRIRGFNSVADTTIHEDNALVIPLNDSEALSAKRQLSKSSAYSESDSKSVRSKTSSKRRSQRSNQSAASGNRTRTNSLISADLSKAGTQFSPETARDHSNFLNPSGIPIQQLAEMPDVTTGPAGVDTLQFNANDDESSLRCDSLTETYQLTGEQPKLEGVSNWLEKLETPTIGRTLSVDDFMAPNVEKAVEMGFERGNAEAALCETSNDFERAVDCLISGVHPVNDLSRVNSSQSILSPVLNQPRTRQSIARSVSSSSSILHVHGRDDDPLHFLHNDEDFQSLKQVVKEQPDLLCVALGNYRESHPDFEPIIEAFECRVVEMLTEPTNTRTTHVPSSALNIAAVNPELFQEQAVTMETTTRDPSALDLLNPVMNRLYDITPVNVDVRDKTLLATDDLMPGMPKRELPRPIALIDDSSESAPKCDDQSGELPVEMEMEFLKDAESYGKADLPGDVKASSDKSTEFGPHVPLNEGLSGDIGAEGFAEKEEEEEEAKDEGIENMDSETEEAIRRLLMQDMEEERMEEEERMRIAEEMRRARPDSQISWTGSLQSGPNQSSSRTGANPSGRGRTLEEHGYVRVTLEEKEAIDRLKRLGFSEGHCVQVYLACGKNEELAANLLLDRD